jgi:predicted Zn-dependent protease
MTLFPGTSGVLFVSCLFGATNAQAYETSKASGTGQELRWTTVPVSFNIHQKAATGVTAEQTQAAIRAAYQSWSAVSCSYLTTADLGLVNNEGGNSQDGVNTNGWLSGWPASYGSSTLGLTKTIYYPHNGELIDADTDYNPNRQWSVSGDPNKIDIQSVVTHEVGHQFGLDHSSTQAATMFYATGSGDTSQRSLHSDDMAGICQLYPSGGQAPPECTSSSQCAPNETCTGGKCVSSGKKGYGASCASPSDCNSGICLQSAGTTFCSELCQSSGCPNGDQCVPATSGGTTTNVCLPNSANRGSKGLGEPCQTQLDCKSEICVSVPGSGYACSQLCTLGLAGSCPNGYSCMASNAGGLCIKDPEQPPPPPPEKKTLGEPCNIHEDCEDLICATTPAGRVCSRSCGLDGGAPCPAGFGCADAGAGNGTGVCIKSAGGTLGDTCLAHTDCKSGVCAADDQGHRFCTDFCSIDQGCVSGYDCVSAGGDKYVCKPTGTITNPPTPDEPGSGCAMARQAPAVGILILTLGLLALGRGRRRRNPPP